MLYKSFDFVKGMPAMLFSKMILQKFLEGATEVVLESELFRKPMVVTRADFEQKYYVENGKLREKEGEEIKYLKPYLLQTGDEAGYLCRGEACGTAQLATNRKNQKHAGWLSGLVGQ